MSYDIRVWGRMSADLSACLPPSQGWTAEARGWVHSARSWQIVVGAPSAVEHEDVPDEIAEQLPGISVLVEVNLEPTTAPKSAHLLLRSTAKVIADALAGVVEDPQEDSLTLPRGAKRYSAPKRDKRFTVLTLSWWYMDSPFRARQGVVDFVTLLNKHVAEAVPRRYGSWEPPQFKTEETGVDALVDFIHQHINDGIVCYTSRPVVGMHISDCGATPDPRLGFRSNCVEIEFEASVLDQPGWESAIRNLWRAVSRFLRPFYGDVRLLADHIASGGTTAADMSTEFHPIRSWFWRGIPPEPGVALVLGRPYSDLWSPASAVRVDDLLFVESSPWAEGRTLGIEVPSHLAQRWMPKWVKHSMGYEKNWCNEMPETWPLPRP